MDPAPSLGRLVVAGGRFGTGRILARRAHAAGYEVRLVDEPERRAALPSAVQGAAAVVIVPARGVRSLTTQVGAVLQVARAAARVPHLVLVSGFSVGHGLAHALNTPERLRDRLDAEDLVRRSPVPHTIVRPTWLTSDPPGGYAVTLPQDPYADGMIARSDLADVCLAAVAQPAARGKTFAVFAQPGETPARWGRHFAALEPDPVS